MNILSSSDTRSGTIGGTLLVVLLQINSAELVKTMALAAIGALVSFIVSLALKWLVNQWRK